MSASRPPMRFAAFAVLSIVVAGALAPRLVARIDESQVDATLVFDQKFFGIVSSALDEDVVAFEDVKGSKLSVTVERDGANFLAPDVDLFDASFALIDTSVVKQLTSTSAKIKNFVLPANGKYHLRVKSRTGVTGTYRLTFHGKPPKKPSIAPGAIDLAGEVDGVAFAARAGSKLSGTITRAGGDLVPLVIELVAPSGALVPITGNGKVKTKGAGTAAVLTNITLPSLGDYLLRFTGSAGTTGAWSAQIKVAPAKPKGDAVYEAEHPNPVDDPSQKFTLREMYFGRGIRSPSGSAIDVVSPFTLVQTDPVSGLPIPGTLKPLFPGSSTTQIVPFELDTFYAPPVVPRNATLVLKFDREVGKESLRLDANNLLTSDSPLVVQVNGVPAVFEVFVKGTSLFLHPVFGDSVGMPASPVLVDASGNPIASSTGAALLSIATGQNGLRAKDGGLYQPRADLIGSPDSGGNPLGFNPGNALLDFFAQSSAGAGPNFSGFLPDVRQPRLVREERRGGVFTPNFANPALGDFQSPTSLSVVTNYPLVMTGPGSQSGAGEFAGGVLRLRPLGPNREQLLVDHHTQIDLGGGLFRHEFFVTTTIMVPLKSGAPPAEPGDAWEVVRAEFFEPDPKQPLDPLTYDPTDPDVAKNQDIRNFVEIRDRNGVLQNAANPVDPRSTLTFRFDESMLVDSARPYESLYVTLDPPDGNFGLNRLGRVVASEGGRALTFTPHREIQTGAQAGTIEPTGFGRSPATYRVHLVTVPSAPVLISVLGAPGYSAFVANGQRGVTDVGGQPLAFASDQLTTNAPFVDYSIPFMTYADPTIEDTGVVVHRFRGKPTTAFGQNGDTGVTYQDMPLGLCGPLGNSYGPRIADVNLFTNGFLSGAPVQFFQKIHDDFNPPPTGQLAPFPSGIGNPLGGFAVRGGLRLQTVYRAIDCSPDADNLRGTLLDLTRVDFTPFGNVVANTIIPDVSIHAGHSAVVPDTSQGQAGAGSGGVPDLELSGLGGDDNEVTGAEVVGPDEDPDYLMGGHFATLGDPTTAYVRGSYNATDPITNEGLRRQVVAGKLKQDALADAYDGVPIVLDQKNLYLPAASPSRSYLPVPSNSFTTPFPFDNGEFDAKKLYHPKVTYGTPGLKRNHSLVLEFRVRVHPNQQNVSSGNTFTFAVGILSSALPRFRVFTMGAGCTACCVAPPATSVNCQNTCAVSIGPTFDGGSPLTTGGPPLEPDRIIHAAGPNVSAPGLPCNCYGPVSNPSVPVGGCIANMTTTSPNLEQVAYGLDAGGNPITPNTTNNFGDNSRYYMVFNYTKRLSLIRSPFVRAQPTSVTNPKWLTPIFEPPLSALPTGTSFDVRFRASAFGFGGVDTSPYTSPGNIDLVNDGTKRPFIQFEARIEGNTSSQLVPVFDEIVIPFRRIP